MFRTHRHSDRTSLLMAGMVIAGFLAVIPSLPALQGTIIQKNGKTQTGNITRVNKTTVSYEMRPGAVAKVRMSDVEEIQFQVPEKLAEAFAADLPLDEDSIKLLQEYAKIGNAKSFFPAPGNLATQSSRKLIEHYRKAGDLEGVARLARQYRPELLPTASPDPSGKVVALYPLLVDKKYDDLSKEVDKMLPDASLEERAEIGFVQGAAYESSGKLAEALAAYGLAYSPGGGLYLPIGASALQRSASILENDPPTNIGNTEKALNALKNIYASQYGFGKVWDGSQPPAIEAKSEADIAAD